MRIVMPVPRICATETIGPRDRSCRQTVEQVVMKTLVVRFLKNESGATAIEYGLIDAVMEQRAPSAAAA